jgi:hypothetical protein
MDDQNDFEAKLTLSRCEISRERSLSTSCAASSYHWYTVLLNTGLLKAVFRIRNRIRIHRIHVFFGLPDPGPIVRVWIRIRILLPSFKYNKKNLESYYFVTLFDFLSLKNNVNVPSKSNKQKKLC